jgi:hypothetical protein
MADLSDIDGVIALQSRYHVSAMSDEDKQQGFVTTAFTSAQLSELITNEKGLFVAKENDVVIAYLMTASWGFWLAWPVQGYMITVLDQYPFQGQQISLNNSYQYGPICIAQSHRGTGLLEKIFNFALHEMAQRYAVLVTFVNKTNTRSLTAHINKLGLSDLGEFEVNDNRYAWLACATKD